jgi:hypothetical protein
MSPDKNEWKEIEAAIQPAVDRDLTIVDGVAKDVLPFTKPLFRREAPNRAPEQIGSGVIVFIADNVFLLTAAHCMQEFHRQGLFIPLDGQYVQLEGPVYRNDPGPSERHDDHDLVDVAILHIKGVHESRLKEIAYPFERCLLIDTPLPTSFALVGYPLRQSKKLGTKIFSYPMGWLLQGRLDDDYQKLKTVPSKNLLFGLSKRVATENGYAPRPALRGFSGCGVWIVPRVDGVDLPHRLVGIYTGTKKEHGLNVATNIRLYSACIMHFCPDLMYIEPGNRRQADRD